MIARSAYVQLRYNPLLLAGTLLGLLLLYAVPPAGLLAGAHRGRRGRRTGRGTCARGGIAGLAGWALMTASFVPMLRLYRLSPLRAPALPLVALLYAAMTADSARRHYSGRGRLLARPRRRPRLSRFCPPPARYVFVRCLLGAHPGRVT